MRKDTQSGITLGMAFKSFALMLVGAAVCARLNGCVTVEGVGTLIRCVGQDVQKSAEIGKAALDKHLWGKDELELHTSIEE